MNSQASYDDNFTSIFGQICWLYIKYLLIFFLVIDVQYKCDFSWSYHGNTDYWYYLHTCNICWS